MLKLENVTKTVNTLAGELTILNSVSMSVAAGESLAIVGASGSGKSTLLGLMAGLDQPSSGSITLAEKNITRLDEDGRAALRAQYVGFVFQSFQLLPSLSAIENVQLPLDISGETTSLLPEKWLERVGLAQRHAHLPSQLSGGEQQRVAIARAFVTEPKILFADEPTGNLDKTTGEKIIELLFELNEQEGTTLVLVTHDEKLANRCQRQITLDGGKIIA